MDSPAVDGFCEHYMDLEGWPDKMLRPEGEEITLTDAEEQEVENARATADAEAARENMEVGPATMKTAIALADEAEKSRATSQGTVERANQLVQVAAAMQADADEAKQVAEVAMAKAEDAVASTKKIVGMAAAAMARAKTDTEGVSLSITEHMSPCMAGLGVTGKPLDHVESLDEAADAARDEAAVLLAKRRGLPAPLTFVKNVVYSTVWTVACFLTGIIMVPIALACHAWYYITDDH
jgi:hypothetical protein